jgi:hypothetical protein
MFGMKEMKTLSILLFGVTLLLASCATPQKRFTLPANSTDADLQVLKNKNISELRITCRNIRSVENLKGLPLKELWLQCTQVSDLSPLTGMKLRYLSLCTSRNIENLTPLRGMPLTGLSLTNTRVTDLTPLAGMPLKHIGLCGSNVKDISPLSKCPLETISFTPESITNGMEMLRQKTTLKKIGGMTAEEFWKKYDTGELKKVPNQELKATGEPAP